MTEDAIYRTNPARDIEKIAVATVRTWLGDRGEVEDTSEGHDPDFRISYRDGRRAIGEVGWHEDEQTQAMWQAVFQQEQHQLVQLSEESGQWAAKLLVGAQIKTLHRKLPDFIRTLNRTGVTHLEPPYLRTDDPHRIAAERLGIEYIHRAADDEPSRAIYFLPATGGAIPTDPDVIVDWIDQVLADPAYHDTTAKLLAVRIVDERHVFIMSGSQTPFAADERLQRVGQALPNCAPNVPQGITHVWLVSRWLNARFGAFAALWVAGEGWSRVPVPVV
jgi:hypothetical protein